MAFSAGSQSIQSKMTLNRLDLWGQAFYDNGVETTSGLITLIALFFAMIFTAPDGPDVVSTTANGHQGLFLFGE